MVYVWNGTKPLRDKQKALRYELSLSYTTTQFYGETKEEYEKVMGSNKWVFIYFFNNSCIKFANWMYLKTL